MFLFLTLINGQPKSVLKCRKSEFDVCFDEDVPSHHEEGSRLSNSETEAEESGATLKRSWSKNRGKAKQQQVQQHRPQLQATRSLPATSSHFGSSFPVKGPRMPDGTRGFTMGRGKPLAIQV